MQAEHHDSSSGGAMAPGGRLRAHLERALSAETGPRLLEDARRLWSRLKGLVARQLVPGSLDMQSLEIAAHAILLPARRQPALGSRAGRGTLAARCEEASELLMELAPANADEQTLDRTMRILDEMPHRSPMLDEARVLADALNLDDFGVTGLVGMMIQCAQNGQGADRFSDGLSKREAYGYWEARLKDGFHFDGVREIARRRLASARMVAAMLRAEIAEDLA